MERIGPSPKPSSPVIPNTTQSPLAERAARGSANQMRTRAPPAQSRYAMGGTASTIESPAVRPLKRRVRARRE